MRFQEPFSFCLLHMWGFESFWDLPRDEHVSDADPSVFTAHGHRSPAEGEEVETKEPGGGCAMLTGVLLGWAVPLGLG